MLFRSKKLLYLTHEALIGLPFSTFICWSRSTAFRHPDSGLCVKYTLYYETMSPAVNVVLVILNQDNDYSPRIEVIKMASRDLGVEYGIQSPRPMFVLDGKITNHVSKYAAHV